MKRKKARAEGSNDPVPSGVHTTANPVRRGEKRSGSDDPGRSGAQATENPEKTQKIMSICLGISSADKKGEMQAKEYEDGLSQMVSEYESQAEIGQPFVHIRKCWSSNRDLKALTAMTGRSDFHKVNLQGDEAESVVTNSAHLAEVIERANCKTIQGLEETLEAEIKGRSWEEDKKDFENHMREEDEVRLNWLTGQFETSGIQCGACGDRNAWDQKHQCCEEQCRKSLNALQ